MLRDVVLSHVDEYRAAYPDATIKAAATAVAAELGSTPASVTDAYYAARRRASSSSSSTPPAPLSAGVAGAAALEQMAAILLELVPAVRELERDAERFRVLAAAVRNGGAGA